MNLWGKQWLGIFGIVFFLFSCEKETEIGEPLNPNGNGVGVFYAEIPVTSSVILNDSVNTTNNVMVGKYENPDFGIIKSNGFAQFLPEKANLEIPQDAVVESMEIKLRIVYFHGEEFAGGSVSNVSPSTINAHLVSEEIPVQRHYAFHSVGYNPEPIGTKSFTLNPITDTIISIPILPDEAYLNRLMELTRGFKGAGDTTTINSFHSELKGLALIPDEDNHVILGMNIYHPDSKISMYVRSGNDLDTVNYRFGNQSPNFIPFGRSFSNIITDRSQTALAGIIPFSEFHPADNMVYLQPGTGLIPKFNIENIKSFVDTAENIIINRADLIMGTVQPSGQANSKYLVPPSSLSLYYTDETSKIKYTMVPDQNTFPVSYVRVPFAVTLPGGNAANPLEANLNDDSYRLQLTDILEAYYLDRIDYNQFLAHPKGIGSPTFLQQAKMPMNSIKLKIYYTKLK